MKAQLRYSWQKLKQNGIKSSFHSVNTVLLRTLVGTVGVSLIAVVSTVIVAVTGPVFWDTAATVTFKLDAGAGMAAAGFITVVPTVIICQSRFYFQLLVLFCLNIVSWSIRDVPGDDYRYHSAS